MRSFKSLTSFLTLLLAGHPSRAEIATLCLGALSAIASGVPFPLIGIFFGQLLDDFNKATCDESSASTSGSGSDDQHDINQKILMIVYLAIAQFITIYIHLSCWSLTGHRLAQRLRETYIKTLLRQEPSYFDSLPPGEVASRLDGDIQTIRSGTSEKVGICLASLSFSVTAYIVAFIKDSPLAGMLVSLLPAYLLMSFVGSHYIEKYAGRMSEHAATAASIASEALSNIVVVSAFGAAGRLEEKFSQAYRDSERDGIKKATAIGVQTGVLYFVAYGANGLAFWQGSKQIADVVRNDSKTTTVGAVFTVIFIMVEATLLLSQVAPFLHMFSAAVGSFEKLRDDLNRQSQIDGTLESGLRLHNTQGCYQLHNISFAYPSRPEVTVLDNVCLSFAAHQHTAIVGLSGSGKSTIASLLTRIYDPISGDITLDNQSIRDVNVKDIRSIVSLVQQDSYLLDRSILENIAHGLVNSNKPEHDKLKPQILTSDLADLAKDVRAGQDFLDAARLRGPLILEIARMIQAAAQLADADSFIRNLQEGYGTLVGCSGRMVSGGQKQRVALARALIKDPKVLILDEATASLDSASEDRIQKAVARVTKGRTVITIAHRLSTISTADNIVVMDKGHVIEQGKHTALMANNGAYANLVKLQTLPKKTATRFNDHLKSSPSDTDRSTSGVIDEKDDGTQTTQSPAPENGDELEEPHIPSTSIWALIRGYGPVLRPHWLTIFLSLLGSILVGGAFSGEAVIFGNTVGSLSPCKTPASILSEGKLFGLMFFVLAVIEFFANLVSCAGLGWVSERIVYTVRVLSFRSLFEQSLEWHQSDGRTPMTSLSYITRDGAALAGLSGSVLGTLFSITVNLFAAVILTHIVAWRIALVCLALVPLLLGAGLMELHVLGQFEEEHETAYAESVAIGVEAASSIKLVASLSLEEEILKTYRRSLDGPRKETLKVTIQASLCQALMYFLGNLVNALAYWWGAKQIIAGHYTQTQFLIVVFSLLVGALLWSQMFALAPELTNARAAMARILSIVQLGSDKMQGHVPSNPMLLEARSKERDVESMTEKAYSASTNRAAAVELQNLHFAYPTRPNMQVLTGLNMNIQPGQFCAFVGPSGAGKSTIISLIERLYTPQSGSVLIDGMNISQHHGASFRDTISLVPQESVLFEGSIAFNIGLGARPGNHVTSSEIEEACKLANIHETIQALPDGYDTLCGPNGNQFSGGQKQRLSIARALVRKPTLLILDEPTSALDAESEKLLQNGLDQATKGITVIAIAHRLHTIQQADVIFLIEGGKCVDSGRHEEIMERSESYRINVMHQTVAE